MNDLNKYFDDRFVNENKGKNLVIFIYPKDNTPAWTEEAVGFTEKIEDFRELNAKIYGISKDSEKSHEKFIDKYNLKVDLISDEIREILKKFQVIKPKKMFGKDVMGIERSTFIFDAEGNLIKEYRKVKVKGHVEEVYGFLKEFINAK